MKRVILCAILLVMAVAVIAQTTGNLLIPVWDWSARRYIWYSLGDGFTVTGQTISVTPAVLPVRVYDVRVTREMDGSYQLPAGAVASSVVVHVNGLRYNRDDDYGIVGDKIVPKYPWTSDIYWTVRIDYDR